MDSQTITPKTEEPAHNALQSDAGGENKEEEKTEVSPVAGAEEAVQETAAEEVDQTPVSEEEVKIEETKADETKAEDTKPEEEIKEPQAQASSSAVHSEDDGSKWFIVHTYSGHEDRVAKTLKQRIQSLGFEDRIFDIIVPKRNTIKVSGGKKESVKEKIFPGYIIVRMILDNESWLLVRTTQGVTSFIGTGNKPTPISEKEVEAIKKFMNMEEPLYKTAFVKGEAIKIVDGPFADFLGTIDEIDEAKGRLKVLVSIFGRETPVELDFLQVTKL